ncbi:MAG: response regulator [Pseudomonadota bacterium]
MRHKQNSGSDAVLLPQHAVWLIGLTRPDPTSTNDEVSVIAAHFSIERLTRLGAVSVDTALACLASDRGADGPALGSSLARRALFSFMVDRSLPIPLDLLGIRSVLLIDDEPAVLRATSRVLRQAAPDLQLVLAEGAKQGLRQIERSTPDAVLVDAYMPEMSGVEVCSRIHGALPTAHLALVAMTADPTPELAAAFARAGSIAFLEKPVGAPALFEALSAHLVLSSVGDS